MSNDADLEYGPTPPGSGYEHTDIDPGVGYRFAIWLAASMVVSAGIVWGTFTLFESRSVAHDAAVQNYPLAVGQSQDPPAPRLQVQPFKDVYTLKAAQRGALHSYGWIDKVNGVVHIPIERAMQLTLEQGLPSRPNGSDAASMVVQDSSAGRTSAPR